MKVLLLENVHPVAAEAFRRDGFDVEVRPGSLSEGGTGSGSRRLSGSAMMSILTVSDPPSGAVAADGAGLHRVAFYLVLLAIPAAAAAALAAAGELAEGRHVAVRICCTTTALGLLLVSSAARANAPEGAGVPAIAVSALLAGVLAYVAIAVAWVLNNRLVTAPIAGPRTEAQWEDYLGALAYRFTAEDEALVDSLVAPGHPSTPGYNDPAYLFSPGV